MILVSKLRHEQRLYTFVWWLSGGEVEVKADLNELSHMYNITCLFRLLDHDDGDIDNLNDCGIFKDDGYDNYVKNKWLL